MRRNWDGGDDQYDESYNWDMEASVSQEMEFSGPEDLDIEASMDADSEDCTCPYDEVLNDFCGHKSDCPACECEFKACDECDCEADHAHIQDECEDCFCFVEPCESCDCKLDHWDRGEECQCEKSHSKERSKETPQRHVWSLDEDMQLVIKYVTYVKLEVIAEEMNMSVDSIRFRLLFLCFRVKGIGVSSTKGANSGKAWTSKEDFFLRSGFNADASLKELSLTHQRSSLAIASRLIKLGLAEPINVEDFHKSETEI